MEFQQAISKEIFESKYMINGEESYDAVFRGVAEEISSVEKGSKNKKRWFDIFYKELASGRFMAGGRILANARLNSKMPYYSNCYTIGIEDSIESIGQSQAEDLIISATGGGVGFNASKLRPKNAPISKGGLSSGVISFTKGFNAYAEVIHTGGDRRSAHIIILNIDHPEIEDFILAKQGDKDKILDQFNLSVGITDKFISAVENDLDWDLVFEGKVYKTVKAKYLYDLITQNAYINNEPGILNLDTINRYNNGYYAFSIEECNPCGEIVMPPYSLCDLGALNLTKFVSHPFNEKASFDFTLFKNTVEIGIRFLDNVLDATKYPLQKIEDNSKLWRRIGLGFTGLGDMFAMLGIPYGSLESKSLSERIGEVLRDYSYRTSIQLAKEKGKFKKCDKKKIVESNFIKQLPKDLIKDIRKYGLRNIGMNTIAPTGTISFSIGQNCSSGIEPILALSYNRTIRTGKGDETKVEKVYDHAWLEYLHSNEVDFEVPLPIPYYFVTIKDINVYDAIDIQAIFQKYIDHSISKTLNLPDKISYEEYNDLFMYAYKKGLKGFTTFNPNGSMKGILSTSEGDTDLKRTSEGVIIRPKKVPCDIHEIKIKGEDYLALVGILDDKPYEIFIAKNVDKKEFPMHGKKEGIIHKVKKGHYNLVIENGEDSVYIDDIRDKFDITYLTFGKLVSLNLRSNQPVQFLAEQLLKDRDFVGYEKAIGRVLKKYIKNGEKVKSSDVCSSCGSSDLAYIEGCKSCLSCGNSKCG